MECKSMKSITKEDIFRFLRFGVVGVIAVGIHYIAYYILLQWWNPSLAYAAGYFISFCCNYVMTTFFTFKQKTSAKNAIGFSISHVINFFIELGILNLLLWFGVDEKIAGIATMIGACPINFIMLRFVYLWKR